MSVLSKLASPFPPDIIRWRIGQVSKDGGKGMALAYIDSRDVQRRLDDVCGEYWTDEIIVQSNGLVTCRIGIWFDDRLVWRQDGTAAMQERPTGDLDAKAEQKIEMSQKGAASDAFKRAAVKWGVGRYLYDLPTPWVKVNQYRQIEEHEYSRLRSMLVRSSQHNADTVSDGEPSLETIKRGLLATRSVSEASSYLEKHKAIIEQLFPADIEMLRGIARGHMAMLKSQNGAAAR